MARRLEGETRRKFAIANNSLEACEDFLTDTDVQEAGGDLPGYAHALLNYLYIPNMVDGVYDTTNAPDEGIPFIIADPGEKITIARHPEDAVHPWQWEYIRNMIAQIDIDEMTDESFELIKKWIAQICYESNGETFSVDMNINAYAFVYAEASAIGISTRVDDKEGKIYGVETRPIIVGNSKSLQRYDARGNMYHELIHVLQFIRGNHAVYVPGAKRKWATRRFELEAYAYQAIAEEAYYGIEIGENTHGWTSMAVEGIRRELNARRKDPFMATKQMMDVFNARNIQIEHE